MRESSLSRSQHTLHQAVCQKLVVAHQSALQGLQVMEDKIEFKKSIYEKTSQYGDFSKE
jgi:hypothetical protein